MDTCNVVIDLSHNNQNVDLTRAQADGIQGIFHKATQGTGFADPAYASRRAAAKTAGLLWGAYHFATGADPVAQAQFFLRVASPSPQDLIVLDFETNTTTPSNTMILDQAHAFIGAVQNAIGRTPGLYGGAYLKEQLGGAVDPQLQACWLWWAQYGPAPQIPPNWPTWTLWQYTDGHHGNPPFTVDGIGPCDRDQYQGTVADLQAKWVTGTLV
jgi:GH25 family lysozyme M1 (1,4-beta-N-acetylmuramidase)